MAQSEIELELKNLFPAHSYEEWKAAAEALLAGKPFDKVLVTPTYEGFDLQPVYRRDDVKDLPTIRSLPGFADCVRCPDAAGYTHKRWKVSQELPQSLPEEVNRVALADLKGEADELNLLLDVASRMGRDPDSAVDGEVGACGVSLTTLGDLQKVLEGVYPDVISLFTQSGVGGVAVYGLILAMLDKKGIAPEKLNGNLGFDPLGEWMSQGTLPLSVEKSLDEVALAVKHAAGRSPEFGVVYANGNHFHNAGASASQELGYLLAEAVEYLRELEKRGVAVETAARSIRLGVGIGGQFFLEVAKLRAARILWARVLEAWGCGFEELPVHIHARTSIANKTRLDPYVNMLRVTTEAFSAVLGGCDSLHVGPFDEVIRVPDDFSRRIARNVHFILSEECDLTRVIDPAGGAYAVEKLTDQIAAEAWTHFQEIEAKGGLIACLRTRDLQKKIEALGAKRAGAYFRRKDVLVGINQYPNATEKPLDPRTPDYSAIRKRRADAVARFREGGEVEASGALMDVLNQILNGDGASRIDLVAKALAMGATLGEVTKAFRGACEASDSIEVLPVRRGAEPFEKLRFAAIDYAASHGHGPRILQVNWGPSRNYRLRADWTSAFYQVGGLEMLNDKDFSGMAEVEQVLKSSGAKVAVITSTDDAYASDVEMIAKGIKAVDAGVFVVVAGVPGDAESAWRAAGVDDFVNVRVNHYEALEALHRKLGVIAG